MPSYTELASSCEIFTTVSSVISIPRVKGLNGLHTDPICLLSNDFHVSFNTNKIDNRSSHIVSSTENKEVDNNSRGSQPVLAGLNANYVVRITIISYSWPYCPKWRGHQVDKYIIHKWSWYSLALVLRLSVSISRLQRTQTNFSFSWNEQNTRQSLVWTLYSSHQEELIFIVRCLWNIVEFGRLCRATSINYDVVSFRICAISGRFALYGVDTYCYNVVVSASDLNANKKVFNKNYWQRPNCSETRLAGI